MITTGSLSSPHVAEEMAVSDSTEELEESEPDAMNATVSRMVVQIRTFITSSTRTCTRTLIHKSNSDILIN